MYHWKGTFDQGWSRYYKSEVGERFDATLLFLSSFNHITPRHRTVFLDRILHNYSLHFSIKINIKIV